MSKRNANTLKKNKSKWAIFSLVNNTKINESQIMGWRIVAGKKVTSEVFIRVIRKFRNEFVVRAVSESEKNKLNNLLASSGNLNFYLVQDMVLFQTEVKHIDSNGDFVFKMPEMIAQIDRRKYMRIFLDNRVKALCTFYKKNHGHKIVNQQFQKECFDISAGGLSFFISKAESKFFEKGDLIEQIRIKIDENWVNVKGDVVNVIDVEPDERNNLHYKAIKVCVKYYDTADQARKTIDEFVFKHIDLEEAM